MKNIIYNLILAVIGLVIVYIIYLNYLGPNQEGFEEASADPTVDYNPKDAVGPYDPSIKESNNNAPSGVAALPEGFYEEKEKEKEEQNEEYVFGLFSNIYNYFLKPEAFMSYSEVGAVPRVQQHMSAWHGRSTWYRAARRQWNRRYQTYNNEMYHYNLRVLRWKAWQRGALDRARAAAKRRAKAREDAAKRRARRAEARRAAARRAEARRAAARRAVAARERAAQHKRRRDEEAKKSGTRQANWRSLDAKAKQKLGPFNAANRGNPTTSFMASLQNVYGVHLPIKSWSAEKINAAHNLIDNEYNKIQYARQAQSRARATLAYNQAREAKNAAAASEAASRAMEFAEKKARAEETAASGKRAAETANAVNNMTQTLTNANQQERNSNSHHNNLSSGGEPGFKLNDVQASLLTTGDGTKQAITDLVTAQTGRLSTFTAVPMNAIKAISLRARTNYNKAQDARK